MRKRKAAALTLPGFIVLLLFSANAQEITVIDQTTGASMGMLSAIEQQGEIFFPVGELAAFSAPLVQQLNGKRVELTLDGRQITVTAFTPFITVDGRRLQMTHDAVMHNGELYLPAAAWTKTLHAGGGPTPVFDPLGKRLSLPVLTPNIISLQAEAKDNGVVLVLKSTDRFFQKDISTHIDKEWIYLTVNGGIFQASAKLLQKPIAEIFEIIPEYAKGSSRLALHLAPGVTLDNAEARPAEKQIRLSLLKSNHNNIAILQELAQERQKWRIDRIIIDPGHGGKDPGCVGPNRLYEKDITLAIARFLNEEIQRRLDVEVIMTRNDDTFVALKSRTQKANQAGGKLFISIHVDANRVKSLNGHTVYFMGPAKTDAAREAAQFENSVIRFEESPNAYEGLSDAAFILAANAQNSFNKESQDLAAMVEAEITKESGLPGHGVRQAGFFVLYGASMPNILIETGFMSNDRDRRNLSSTAYQKSLARAVCNALIKFKERYESLTF